jgi:hypothetical protein
MQWHQDPNQSNLDNLSNLRREISTYFMNKKNENLKAKIDDVETNSRTKISETYIGVSVTLRMVTSLELI